GTGTSPTRTSKYRTDVEFRESSEKTREYIHAFRRSKSVGGGTILHKGREVQLNGSKDFRSRASPAGGIWSRRTGCISQNRKHLRLDRKERKGRSAHDRHDREGKNTKGSADAAHRS